MSFLNHLLELFVAHYKVALSLLHVLRVRAIRRIINSDEVKIAGLQSFLNTFYWKDIL